MRPLVIGEQPGRNTRTDCPVFPYPATSSAGRLLKMLGVSGGEFLRSVDRVNAVPTLDLAHGWDPVAAEDYLAMMYNGGLFRERRVLVLGARVRATLGFDAGILKSTYAPEFRRYRAPRHMRPKLWYFIPHPSGLNRWYNDPDNVRSAQLLLEEWYGKA